MIAAWMVYGIILSALIGGAAWTVDRIFSLYRLPQRWVWIVAIPVSALAPLFARWRPSPGGGAAEAIDLTGAVFVAPTEIHLLTQSWMDLFVTNAMPIDSVLLIGWVGASALIIGGLTLATLRMQRESREWPVTDIDGVEVRVSNDTGPAVIGTFPSAIVVPAWLADIDAPRREAVVRHEYEHQSRGDTRIIQVALALASCVPWMLPLWWQFGRLREAIEIDCDRRVLNSGVNAPDYARLLLDLTNKSGHVPGPATTLADRPSILTRRINAMFTRKIPLTGVRAAGLAGIAGLIAVAACETPAPPVEPPLIRAEASELDQGPVRISGPAPRYPAMLREAGIEGSVTIRMIVLADGTVDSASVEVLQSTNAAFDAPAMSTLRRSLFDPAIAGGEPVAASIEQTVQFRMQKTPPDGADIDVAFRPADTSLAFFPRSADDNPLARIKMTDDTAPLIVIDGQIMTDRSVLATLEPATIERIEILKGSAARGQYGEQAANGVVQIFLKN